MSRVPRIRFKGFEEDWEQRKLGECFTERIESMPDGELISVTINDGVKKFSELGRHDNSNDDKSKYKKVCIGDIAYNSMRMWQGASGYSYYDGIVSPAYTVLSANYNVNSKFIAYQFKLPKMIHTFKINSQGITSDNWNLKFPALSDIPIFISKQTDEQGKIAFFLENLDHLITLHQRKLEKLKIIKKSMLENLFPKNEEKTPQIRFSGFTYDWEQRKLGELATYFEYGLNVAAKEYDGENKYIRITDIDDESHEFRQDNLTSPDTDLSVFDKYKLSDGDLLLSRTGASVGKSYIYKASDGLVYYAGFLIRARIKEENNSEFVYQNTLTSKYVNFIKVTSMRSGQPGVNAQEYSQFEIMIPSKAEQDTITYYFSNLDHLITLHQSKLENLQKIKKSMLESMFI